MRSKKMLTSFLLPFDSQESFQGTAALVGSMAKVLGDRMVKGTLLHVMQGSYIANHMGNIDVRVEHVLSSELIRRLRQEHIGKTVQPEMEKAAALLKEAGVSIPVDTVVKDGKPADVIADMVADGDYSTLVMQRRGLSKIEGMFTGSVTSRILHRNLRATVYLTGNSPASLDWNTANILIAIDESDHSMAALEEAGTLLGKCAGTRQAVLVSVADVASYASMMKSGRTPEEQSLSLLDKAASRLESDGVPADRIVKVARYGKDVASVIEEEAKDRGIDTVFMGRRGISTIAEFFIGSVSQKVVDRCHEQTVALVTAD